MIPLAELPFHVPSIVQRVDGPRAYRRRLLEMGLVPGTSVQVVRRAPLGDPLELVARGSTLSIRLAEAELVLVEQPL